MKSFPSCWNKTPAQLGFRRKLRKKVNGKAYGRRPLFENLETREMLAADYTVNTLNDSADTDLNDNIWTLREAFSAAMDMMHRAHEYAEDSKSNRWQFAIEIEEFWKLGLTKNDLRWLLARGIVLHAREILNLRSRIRQFEPQGANLLDRNSCFILSDDGIHKIAQQTCAGMPATAPITADPTKHPSSMSRQYRERSQGRIVLPEWNHQRRELHWKGSLIKRFRSPAANQELVILAFQEEKWSARIDDPLPPLPEKDSRRRLNDTIKCLNRHQVNSLMFFRGDGSGNGILWEARASTA